VSTLHLDYPKIIEVQVILDVQKYRHQAEVILHCSNHVTLEASATSNDMYASIDQVVLRIARQMRKCKTRLMRNHRPGRRQQARVIADNSPKWEWLVDREALNGAPIEEVESEVETETNGPDLIQTEKYPVKPMSPEEAVLQMEFSKKQFLVFLNAKTEKVSVLYRRKHGDFGLIEPTFN
ncbi:MAG: ribosome-associated translation inhibitor RaiA, partial [Verrucomicrobia bacterium]|nr:ribosome-associated translation inhibitor RaiA [Verrucomicrobiota bacterium]MBV8482404.1 ribosome-associated translation inhibitor RaiA [Verrucomicrobiota bacterium]